jgi:hypothetical protein
MFLAAQWLSALGLRRLRTRGVPLGLAAEAAVMMLGVACTALPFLAGGPLGSVPLWLSLLFRLDPLNRWLGAPSVLGDWRAGRWGRTLSLMAGGSICGLCWEFWNYWALAKWTYHLPFLGALEHYRYFEMPWLGFLGFPAFGVECWVALNTVVVLADHLGLRVVESLPEDWAVL